MLRRNPCSTQPTNRRKPRHQLRPSRRPNQSPRSRTGTSSPGSGSPPEPPAPRLQKRLGRPRGPSWATSRTRWRRSSHGSGQSVIMAALSNFILSVEPCSCLRSSRPAGRAARMDYSPARRPMAASRSPPWRGIPCRGSSSGTSRPCPTTCSTRLHGADQVPIDLGRHRPQSISSRSASVIMLKPLAARVSMPISVLSTISATAGWPRGLTMIG